MDGAGLRMGFRMPFPGFALDIHQNFGYYGHNLNTEQR